MARIVIAKEDYGKPGALKNAFDRARSTTDEEALALVMTFLQRVADTAYAAMRCERDETDALCEINNSTRDMIDALSKRRVS